MRRAIPLEESQFTDVALAAAAVQRQSVCQQIGHSRMEAGAFKTRSQLSRPLQLECCIVPWRPALL